MSPFLLGNDVKAVRVGGGLPPRTSWATGFWSWIPIFGAFIFASKVQNALNEYWVSQGATPR